MNQFFDAISEMFGLFVNYVSATIDNLLMVFGMIGKAVVYVIMLVQFMPAPIRVVLIALLSYIIIVNVLKLGG